MRSRTPSDETREPHRRARDDSGLTTLEWLLIVAAVAGLAALAVVLVQNVVGDTSEQIAGSSARKTAAQIAATEIMSDAARIMADQPDSSDTWSDWAKTYTAKCNRLKITYGDADIKVSVRFSYSGGPGAAVTAATGDVSASDLATIAAAGNDTAVAHCAVS